MTVKLIEETAATSSDSTPVKASLEETASTASHDLFALGHPGLFVAGLVLSAALGAAPHMWNIPESVAYTGRRRDEHYSESATESEAPDPVLVAEVRELFERGATEFFEDGIDSVFSRALLKFLAQNGSAAFQAIAEYFYSGDANPDVVSEALRRLAEFGDATTLRDRWSILQQMLRARSPRVRDGAILGFAALDHPGAKSVLIKARQVEQIAELRRLIDEVIAQLDAARDAAAADRGSGKPLA